MMQTSADSAGSNAAEIAPARPKRRLRRVFRSLIRIAVATYVGLAIVLAAFQTKLIFPGAATQGQRQAVVRPAEGAELLTLTTPEGERVAALFGAALSAQGQPLSDPRSRPTLLFFYGNGMCMADTIGEFMTFRRLGMNVMIPDYLGYGMSGGKPGEAGVYASADACYEHLQHRKDIDARSIIPVGWSLGAAAAVHLASEHPTPGLVTLSAFTSMGDMAHHLFPYMPTSLLLEHHFENERKLRAIKCPVLIVHGTRDRIVTFPMSAKLKSAAAGAVSYMPIEGGDHNDLFDVGGEALFQRIAQFVEQCAARSSTRPATAG
jgi:fermentation-respiration switch protein FrsA (DUF1100 family)